MKTFHDYVVLRERSSYEVGDSILGGTSLSGGQEGAMTSAFQAFNAIAARMPSAVVRFLNTYAPQVDPMQFPKGKFKESDFQSNFKSAAKRGNKFVTKGLGEVGPEDDDVVSPNAADSYHNPIG